MQNPNYIKLEMAQMSIRAARLDDGEKMIQELIFSGDLDYESLSVAWFSYGCKSSAKSGPIEVIS